MAKKAAKKPAAKEIHRPVETFKAGKETIVASLQNRPGYKFCPHCDASIPARSATCPKCNKPMPAKAKAKKAAPKKSAKGNGNLVGNGLAPRSYDNGLRAVELIRMAREFVTAAGGTAVAAELLLALQGSETRNG